LAQARGHVIFQRDREGRAVSAAVSSPLSDQAGTASVYRFPIWFLALLAGVAVLIYIGFDRAIDFMVGQWDMDEFSHGWLIPFISGFLIWQRRDALRRLEFRGAWSGVAVVAAGLALGVVGRLTSLFTIQHLALLVVIAGLTLALAGRSALRLLAPPLAVLIFMIPLPNILLNTLSSELQLISSGIGVWLMRLAGIAVFLQGNVIDLGSYKLEVAEACSGLRYLLPLMTLSFLMACFYRTAVWKRLVLFLSSIPITVLMNSLRIALIGIMVDHWGTSVAEGLLHQVQGWMMFMLSTAILLLEVIVFSRLDRARRPWRELFGLETPAPIPAGAARRLRALPSPLLAGASMLLLFSVTALALPSVTESIPARENFASFPLRVGTWTGQREALDKVYLDALRLDDYLLADYVQTRGAPVNLYVAWYDTQRAGYSTHSPKACLPAGGWRIEDLREVDLANVRIDSRPLRVNRALIQYGDQRQLVYYWFQQRGRVVTNEYLVKWYLLVDTVLRHRTDGALVRLITPAPSSVPLDSADHTLQGFAAAIASHLDRYLPG
jgi:exosortase D (VPLPA-CTERM-specific)